MRGWKAFRSGLAQALRQRGVLAVLFAVNLVSALLLAALPAAALATGLGRRPAVRQAVDSGLEFDAVFTNDETAIGVLRALHETGRSVPEDVAVAGCDGLAIGLQTTPSLTTVIMDLECMGRMAVERVFSRDDDAAPRYHVRLLPELVVRESTTPARADA